MKRILWAAVLFLGCSSHKPAAIAAAERHSTTGVIQSFENDGHRVIIAHKEMPGFMEAMTMSYDLLDPHLGDGLKVGDHVRFTITKTEDGWPISEISPEKGR